MERGDYDGDIETIIASKSFGKSGTYANLLRYLVKCSANDNVPKETTIAAEIFGKNDFDPSQSTLVRVYVYNLRKKLKNYYQNEGSKESKIVKIPKGSYAIEIAERKNDATIESKTSKWRWAVLLATLLIASLGLNFFLGSNSKKTMLVDKNGLWKDLIESELPKMVVLGDLFIYSERDTATTMTRTIRGPNINSLQEFEEFKSKNAQPDIEIGALTYTYLILGSAQWIKKLSEIILSIESDYTIRTMSRFNPKQLQDYNIIVVGMHKTLGVFRSFYKNSYFEYDAQNDAFIYKMSESDEPIVYKPKGDADSYHTDYSLMAKVPGPNNNTIYLFSGIWDTGATQSLKNFTDAKLLEELETRIKSKFGTLPQYYEVFFEVNGIDRMELSSKVLHINKLEDVTKRSVILE